MADSSMGGNAQKRPRSAMDGDGEKRQIKSGPCFMKLLVPDVIAGSIIGKKGSNLQQIQQQTGVLMRLSAGQVYFPGTNERIVIASGELESVKSAFVEVMNKQKESTANNDMNGDFSAVSMQCKLVLPNSAISIVIGKGGEAVKLLMSNTGAKVVASARQEQLQERIVTITGTFEQAQAAGLDLLTRVQEDTNLGPMIQNGVNASDRYHQLQAPNWGNPGKSPGGGGGKGGNFGQSPGMGMGKSPGGSSTFGYGHNQINPAVAIQQVTIEFQVLNTMIGPIIGKGGSLLRDISQRSGAKIKIADKDQTEGDARKFFISGPLESVHTAHSLIVQRVVEVNLEMQQQAAQAQSAAALGNTGEI